MRLFFYGTLLDPDVRSLVLGRFVAPEELVPAVLPHFRRIYVAGRSYPMILPHRGGAVDGVVATCLTRDDLARIALYEGDGYRLERQMVVPVNPQGRANDERFAAWIYRSRPATRPSAREWRLSVWQSKEKASYVRDTRDWLTSRTSPQLS
jgi:hypothetical protein